MDWRPPWSHAVDWYFCSTNITGFDQSTREKIEYSNLPSAMRPVSRSDDFPVPRLPVSKDFSSSSAGENVHKGKNFGCTDATDKQACIGKLLKSHGDMECRMSLEILFLHFHRNFFSPSMSVSVMGMGKDCNKTLQRWMGTVKANGTPTWLETSSGCSCMTPQRQNTQDPKKTQFRLSVVPPTV